MIYDFLWYFVPSNLEFKHNCARVRREWCKGDRFLLIIFHTCFMEFNPSITRNFIFLWTIWGRGLFCWKIGAWLANFVSKRGATYKKKTWSAAVSHGFPTVMCTHFLTANSITGSYLRRRFTPLRSSYMLEKNRDSLLNTKFCHFTSQCCCTPHQSKHWQRYFAVKRSIYNRRYDKRTKTRMRRHRIRILTGLRSSPINWSPILRVMTKGYSRESCLSCYSLFFFPHP